MNPRNRTTLARCLCKVQFQTEAVAARFARVRDLNQKPYRCNHCRKFHLTTRKMASHGG